MSDITAKDYELSELKKQNKMLIAMNSDLKLKLNSHIVRIYSYNLTYHL